MKHSTEEFVEIPRWVRVLTDGRPLGLPFLNRRQAHVEEAISMGIGAAFLIASFLLSDEGTVAAFRVSAALFLGGGYLMSIINRITDTYRAWPTTGIATPGGKAAGTSHGTMAFSAIQVLVALLLVANAFLR